jgi:hypothetical protein
LGFIIGIDRDINKKKGVGCDHLIEKGGLSHGGGGGVWSRIPV